MVRIFPENFDLLHIGEEDLRNKSLGRLTFEVHPLMHYQVYYGTEI
jgi:hypothetical protein